jgi:MFS transporter, NNP family, nitrate/nitrite transporter
MPDGNYGELQKKGSKDQARGYRELTVALANYRTWILLLTYGYCFGVELTLDNTLAGYFGDQFSLSIKAAGATGWPSGTLPRCCLQPV